MARTCIVPLAAALLAACSLIDPAPEPREWTRATGEPDQTAADLRACRAEAEAVIRRDAAIDRDIESAFEPVDPGTAEEPLRQNLDVYSREQRHNRIVADCMRARGYVLPEKSPL